MQIRPSNFAVLQRNKHRLSKFTAAFCLICFSLAQGASQLTNTKRITALQVGESTEGSRVTVTGDSLLDDYEAFRRGDRFYVRIPSADFIAPQPRFQGNGFEDVQVQRVGDSVVISFRLHPGANARVIGASNRLEVIFSSPNQVPVPSSATAVRNRVTRNSASGMKPSPRSSPKNASDVAGPTPPDSPNSDTDYSAQNASSMPSPKSRTSTDALRRNAVSTNGAVPAGTPMVTNTPVPVATPYAATSPYSSTYPPATSTYTPPQIPPVAQTNSTSSGFESRGRAVLQWVKTNKSKSAAVGITVVSLLGVVLFLLYRSRRNRSAAVAKASRVQPKYSPDAELEDILTTPLATESSHEGPEEYVNQDAYEDWGEDTKTDELFFEDLTTTSRANVTYHEEVAPAPYDAVSESSWEYFPEPNPQAYKSRLQEEREVFEL